MALPTESLPMPAFEPVRIVEPIRLGTLHAEARRRERPPLSGWEVIHRLFVLGLYWVISSAFLLIPTAGRLMAGKPVGPWRWMACAFVGPTIGVLAVGVGFGVAKFIHSVERALYKVGPDVARFAEIRKGRVLLWPVNDCAYAFRPRSLVSCKIEPDRYVPEFYHLVLHFRPGRFLGTIRWSMLVEDVAEAEAFQWELIHRFG